MKPYNGPSTVTNTVDTTVNSIMSMDSATLKSLGIVKMVGRGKKTDKLFA